MMRNEDRPHLMRLDSDFDQLPGDAVAAIDDVGSAAGEDEIGGIRAPFVDARPALGAKENELRAAVGRLDRSTRRGGEPKDAGRRNKVPARCLAHTLLPKSDGPFQST